MTFVVGHTREAANTSTGNQTFTITWADGGNHTPTAIEIYLGKGTANGIPVDGAFFSWGAATASDKQWVRGYAAENGVTTTDTQGYFNTGEVAVVISNDADSVEARASFVSFGENTVTLNWTTAPAGAYFVTIKAFTGTDSAVASTVNPSTVNLATVDATDLGVSADYVFFSGTVQFQNASSSLGQGGIVIGYYTYDGETARNYGIGCGTRASRSTTEITFRWGSDWVGGEARNGGAALDSHYTLSPHASGFSVTTYEIAGLTDHPAGYLALKLPSGIQAKVGSLTTKATTGNEAYTGIGFKPQSLTLIGGYSNAGATTRGGTTPSESSSPDTDNFFFGTAIETSEYSISLTDHDGVSTTNNQTLETDTLARVVTDTGTERISASLASLDEDGFTLNFTTAGNAVDWIFVAFEEDEEETPAEPSYTTLTSYEGSNDNSVNFGTSFVPGQGFQVQEDALLMGISFYGNRRTDGSGTTFKVEIRSGTITGTLVYSEDFDNTDIPTTPDWQDLFFASSTPLTAGTQYFLRLVPNNGTSGGEFDWYIDTTSSSYPYGSRWQGTSESPTFDKNFRIYGQVQTANGSVARRALLMSL